MTSIVGLDIGSGVIRGVEVEGFDTAKPVIVRRGEITVPETALRRGEVVESATVATALKRLWSQSRFKTKNVVLGVGGQRVFARDLSVPAASLAQIREALPFQVSDLLPVPASDALLDFYPIAEESGENGAPMVSGLLVAALKDVVDTNVNAVVSAGLRPVHVDLLPFALSRAIAPLRSPRGREMLVEIGANATNIVVVNDGVPSFVRMIASGGDDITRAIAARLQWQPAQAEAAKRALGMGTQMMRPEDRPVLEIIYEVVGELLAGVRNTLSYYASSKPTAPVARIQLAGGGGRMIGLPNALADVTGLPVGIADPLVGVSVAKGVSREDDGSLGTALGLALGDHS